MPGLLTAIKSRLSRQLIFSAIAALLVLMLAGFIIYSSIFLISNLNKALTTELKEQSLPQFDLEGFEKLNLVKTK